uniref:Uncharacterized protein LOC104244909 n=1 Tax=Nicotiana sylvestris TaxID=4096 RepID=A0A1U7YIS3_NICSY|nr:PREDICTED: uncharacterized protein LOC104244909 [Nicotiana sylvestris]
MSCFPRTQLKEFSKTVRYKKSGLPGFGGTKTGGFESCADSRRSVISLILFLGGCPISWKSKKHPTIALSSVDVEYRALRLLVVEVTWVLRLLIELGVSNPTLVAIHCDSQSATHIAKNPIFMNGRNILK